MGATYDFCGWATKNDLKCSDGRIIRKDAFKENDGTTVPLVWNHQHDDPADVLGHALLENRETGVYAYCTLNDTEAGERTKKLVKNGDITGLSIYANKLKQQGGNVIHGAIREVSVVLAPANPGAYIEDVLIHGESMDDQGIILVTGESLAHSDSSSKEENQMAEEKKPEEKKPESGKSVKDIYDTLNEDQKKVVNILVGLALEDAANGKKDDKSKTDTEENKEMKHNVFESDEAQQENVLSHSDMEAVFADAKRYGSLRESTLAHGISDIEYLFPEAHNLNTTPEFIQRKQEWVSTVMNGVHKSPFSRIKSMFADITEDDARALGYLPDHTHRDSKGNLVDAEGNPAYKKEEVFGLLKRTTTPTTIYKKQKLDRDDVVDITDFDVVSWIKTEMRGMLDEEIARAILIGDGRLASSDDKINESNIRPICEEPNLFNIKCAVTLPATVSDDDRAKAFIKAAVKAHSKYRGTGTPTFFTTEDVLTDMLLIEDGFGHRLYKNETELASAMRVSKIVTVPVMEGAKTATGAARNLVGIIVNLADYNVGADKGGAVNLFDDFDIDYNAQKYLIETRCSGALTKPYSAITMTYATSDSATAPTFTITTGKEIA